MCIDGLHTPSLPSFDERICDQPLVPSQLEDRRPVSVSSSGGSAQSAMTTRPSITANSWLKQEFLWTRPRISSLSAPSQHWNTDISPRDIKKTTIPVTNADFLRRYYEKIFHNLQQINCRILAKAYVKAVEPHKQVHFPYNGRKTVAGRTQQLDPENTKPQWWPPRVTHREPDHLPKVGKILEPLSSVLIYS